MSDNKSEFPFFVGEAVCTPEGTGFVVKPLDTVSCYVWLDGKDSNDPFYEGTYSLDGSGDVVSIE